MRNADPCLAIPTELSQIPQWLVWRYEHRGGRATKVPICPASGARASTTDPATWATFEEAVAAWRASGYDGVGFVFSTADPYCGVDLDDCLDDRGNLSADAAAIVEKLNTYAEISPSGRGVKLIVRGKLPARGRRKGKVEMYDAGRFFTVTGHHLPGTPATVEARQQELEALHAETFGRAATTPKRLPDKPQVGVDLDDEQLLAKARQAKNGDKFVSLYDRGDIAAYDNDDSAADLALCGMLAFWSGGDPMRLDRMFRRSALMRPKWDEKRGDSTYGGITLAKALATTTEFFGSQQPAPPSRADQDEALRELWALGQNPAPSAVQAVLGRVAAGLTDDANPLAVQTARELAIRALRGKVSSPAKLVDVALAPVTVRRKATGDTAYRATRAGLVYLKPTKEGEVPVPLTNFTASIVGQILRDDGVETRRSFEIEAHLHGRRHRFEVSAARFPAMGWVVEHLGADAVVNAGLGTKDHTRAAIQHLSDQVETRTLYSHLGWRRIGDTWAYLHAGGAIGPHGPVADVETDLPKQLQGYILPDPPAGDDLVAAVRASLGMLAVLPDRISLPVFCSTWRAVLGPCDFSLHLAGPTGEGKSEAAALAQQHYGPALDARHLPGSWSSTGNALEALGFAAKDALLVVDDFAPEGSVYDIQRHHREAARLLRAQGNQSGRSRLRPDGELRSVKEPRGFILSTGEDVPNAQSIRARLLVLDVGTGAMDWTVLTECQKAAGQGLYAQAMAGFLRWTAARYDELPHLLRDRTAELRIRSASAGASHRRTPTIVAHLAFGLEVFLAFAQEIGALSEIEAKQLWDRGWTALGEAAGAQVEHLSSADPVRRFFELLASALASGRAHVASSEGTEPENPSTWGWREKLLGIGDHARREHQPQGECIGWLGDGSLYLEPDAAFKTAQGMAVLDGLSVTPRTLWKRLKERGVLVTTEERRGRNTVRVTLQGARREVLHVAAESLLGQKPSQSSQPSQGDDGTPSSGPLPWDGSGPADPRPSQEIVPTMPMNAGLVEPDGTVGTIGTVLETDDLEGWEEP